MRFPRFLDEQLDPLRPDFPGIAGIARDLVSSRRNAQRDGEKRLRLPGCVRKFAAVIHSRDSAELISRKSRVMRVTFRK